MKVVTNEKGMVLTVALIIGVAFSIISLAVVQYSLAHFTTARRSLVATDALAVAEAGADSVMLNLNKDSSYGTTCPTFSSPTVLFDSSTPGNTKGKGTYETCVEEGTITGEKIIYSTGKIYLPDNASTPTSTRKIKVVAEQSISGGYVVIAGIGGLTLGENTHISGNVYVDGKMTMGNNSQIGTSSSPAEVNVSYHSCTPLPTACTTPPNPVTVGLTAHIYGEVNANYQTDGSRMTDPGLTSTSGVPLGTLPDWDRPGTKSTIDASGNTLTGAEASSCPGGTKTWPANVKITGNVNLPNNCVVTAQGNVWITGNLTTNNNTIVRVDNGLTTAPIIMIDGGSGLSLGNNTSIAANSGGIGFRIITYWSADACGADCTNVTGTALGNSMNVQTINFGNNSNVAGTIFYARWSKIVQGNNGTVGAIIGQTVVLNNNGNLSFNSAIAGGATVWDVRFYEPLPN